MRILLLLFLAGISAACSNNPVVLPVWDLEPAEIEAQKPLTLPVLPSAGVSGDLATFGQAEMVQLERYVTTSEGNYLIALANAEALESQAKAYNALIEAGKMQRQIAVIRQEMLDQERSDHFVDNMTHRIVILVGGLLVVL